ncbi:hypothetical protein CYMTET_54987 [Cymbomonas tetramitiformis]|uniref:HAT C-terminal dimerisation domain-containing protein n=1 Tax=Cymbomonas tetramitiformis TaxID=36881 RepID=A0AAE0BEZ7_9CHLO|nr:hypothetical protein CYMTET_54987 [Cymbomonas tetramitiformis]
MFDVESLQLKMSTDDVGSTYRDFQLDLTDWQTIQHALPVLQPVYDYTRIIQGTKYVTMSLVLPMTAYLIECELDPTVDLVLADGSDCIVSTLLDPRFKNWDFDGCNIYDGGNMTRDRAMSLLRTAWTNFKPTVAAEAARSPAVQASDPRSFGEASFLRKKTGASTPVVKKDQLDCYLSLPQEANEDGFDVMVWWNEKAKDLPDVFRMALQFLGCPATTAGVERTFSAAGRMHDDLRKNTEEDTLEHMLRVRISDCCE